MGPWPSRLLGLALCLSQAVHMQEGALPKPSISVERGPVLRRRQFVTIVCRVLAEANTIRLEVSGNPAAFRDEKRLQRGSEGTEARFQIPVDEAKTRSYYCHYHTRFGWSEHSDVLVPEATDEDVSTPLSEAPGVARPTPITYITPTSSAGLSVEYVYILVGVSVAFLLCLLLLVLFLVHRLHQKKRGPPRRKGEEPRPRERLSPTVDLIESTADVATVDAPPEEDRDTHSPNPAEEDPQEVTYAQLDQRALTLRAPRAVSPQSTEPTGDLSTYATLPRP